MWKILAKSKDEHKRENSDKGKSLKGKRNKIEKKTTAPTSIYSPRKHLMQGNRIANDEPTRVIIKEKES